MPFTKGNKLSPGRPKGAENFVTTEIKTKAIAILREFSPELAGWIRRVAKKNPEKAYYMVMYPQEFAFPKLGRTELTAKDGDPLIMINVTTESPLQRPSKLPPQAGGATRVVIDQ